MNRISIYESDLTTNGRGVSNPDVVYVPGFAIGGDVGPRVPTLCTSIQDFIEHFGPYPAPFWTTQQYPIKSDSQTAFGFDAIAVPPQDVTNGAWMRGVESTETGGYRAYSYDPAYIYARECLLAGLPVIYERINKVATAPQWTEGEGELAVTHYAFPFDKTRTYASGEHCVHADPNNPNTDAIFRCNTAIETPGEWQSTDWVITSIPCYDVTIYNFYYNLIGNLQATETEEYNIFDLNNSPLLDKGEFSVKYITTGGYPNYEFQWNTVKLCDQMAIMASTRGDAVALIDHTNYTTRPILATNTKSVYNQISMVKPIIESSASYAAMFTPWGVFSLSQSYTANGTVEMPGSFAYLMCLANTAKNYSTCLAVAGVGRGLVPNLVQLNLENQKMTNSIANSYQKDLTETGVSINPITFVKPYGLCIWGNRTLAKNATISGFASTFLNQRNMLSDIKKQIYMAAQSCMFEQNDDALWVKFTSLMSETLDNLVANSGISSYQLIKKVPTDKTKLVAVIKVYPTYAVESFDVYVTLTDEDVTVE